jgi:uncharacterized protein
MLSESRGAIRLSIHVQPGARKNAVLGVHDGALKVAVSAPPVDGKANEAISTFIAEAMHVPGRAVTVVSGHASRRKVLNIESVTMEEVKNRLARLLPPAR